jgi:hypothetical protein
MRHKSELVACLPWRGRQQSAAAEVKWVRVALEKIGGKCAIHLTATHSAAHDGGVPSPRMVGTLWEPPLSNTKWSSTHVPKPLEVKVRPNSETMRINVESHTP